MVNRRVYNLDHCTYRCEYHIVWVCKYRGKALADNYIKQEMGRIIKQICRWKKIILRAWHLGDEHIHLVVSIPPKYSIAYVIGVLKGKTSTWIKKKTKKLPKGSLWCRGYFVSTVGIDEYAVKNYVKNQQHHQVEMPKLPL